MDEQEMKTERDSYIDALTEVMKSLKGTPLPTDFNEFETPLTAEIVEKLHEALRRKKN